MKCPHPNCIWSIHIKYLISENTLGLLDSHSSELSSLGLNLSNVANLRAQQKISRFLNKHVQL
jgi:hypothetical protein